VIAILTLIRVRGLGMTAPRRRRLQNMVAFADLRQIVPAPHHPIRTTPAD
jgi:hypothetical protein